MNRSPSRNRGQQPTLKQVEAAIGEPASRWSGRCYEIASAVVNEGLLGTKARAVYGHFLGRVSAAGFVQHGWVDLGNGLLFDPTRWVFEAAPPYLWRGPPGDEYDEGGNKWRVSRRTPPPEYDPGQRSYEVPRKLLKAGARAHIERLLQVRSEQPRGRLSMGQLMWVANAAPDELGRHAAAFYEALAELGLRSFVPIDNLRMVEARTKRAREEKGRKTA
jgi:hypothetical protein